MRARCAVPGCSAFSVPRPEPARKVPGAGTGSWHHARALAGWLRCSRSGLPTRRMILRWRCWQGAGEARGRVRLDLCWAFCNVFCHFHPDFTSLGKTYIRQRVFLLTSGGSWGQHKASCCHLRQRPEQLQASLLTGAWSLPLGNLVEAIWPFALGSRLARRECIAVGGRHGVEEDVESPAESSFWSPYSSGKLLSTRVSLWNGVGCHLFYCFICCCFPFLVWYLGSKESAQTSWR